MPKSNESLPASQAKKSPARSQSFLIIDFYLTLSPLYFVLLIFLIFFLISLKKGTFQMTLRSPERRLKDQPHMLKSTQAALTTPQRTQTSKVKVSMGTPTRQQTGEISSACRVQLERLSVEEICSAQSVLQPKHHSTPVTVKSTSRG